MIDKVKMLYFASLAELLGIKEEIVSLQEVIYENKLSSSSVSIGEMKHYLSLRGGAWSCFGVPNQMIFVAVNYEKVKDDFIILKGCEVAFFPPVTGG